MYKLVLEKVICEQETPGWGSDEFELSIVFFNSMTSSPLMYRWAEDDFDSDESREPNIVIYEGEIAPMTDLSFLGIEIDNRRKGEKLLSDFEENQSISSIRRLSFDERVIYIYGSAAVIGIILSGILGGGIGGVVLGIIVAIVTELIYWPIRVTDPDTIVYDHINYIGASLQNIFDRLAFEDPPSTGYFRNVGERSPYFENSVSLKVNDFAFVEDRIYTGDSSRYHLIFRHELTPLI